MDGHTDETYYIKCDFLFSKSADIKMELNRYVLKFSHVCLHLYLCIGNVFCIYCRLVR